MIIIGIDPAATKPIAYAVWRSKDDKIGTGKTWDLILVGKVKDPIDLVTIFNHAGLVSIEDQYFKCNVKTLKQLVRCAGEIIGICKMLDVPFKLTHPLTWQKAVGFKYGRKPPEVTTYFWKTKKIAMLKKFASDLIGSEVEDEDIAAAILIGYAEVLNEN